MKKKYRIYRRKRSCLFYIAHSRLGIIWSRHRGKMGLTVFYGTIREATNAIDEMRRPKEEPDELMGSY